MSHQKMILKVCKLSPRLESNGDRFSFDRKKQIEKLIVLFQDVVIQNKGTCVNS